MLRAVLDANAYVSAYVRPEGGPGQVIERFLRLAAFELVLSTEIAAGHLHALPVFLPAGERPFRDATIAAMKCLGFAPGGGDLLYAGRRPLQLRVAGAMPATLTAATLRGDRTGPHVAASLVPAGDLEEGR